MMTEKDTPAAHELPPALNEYADLDSAERIQRSVSINEETGLPKGWYPENEYKKVVMAEKDTATAMIHLYRAELGRLTVYRTRLDATTNWSVTSTGLLVTFSLGNNLIPHYFFSVIAFLLLAFLMIEARRYIYFASIKTRCRLMEQGFFCQAMGPVTQPDWEKLLHRSYAYPRKSVALLQAMRIRFLRNYIYLFIAVWMGWVAKLIVHSPDFVSTFPYLIPVSVLWLGILVFSCVRSYSRRRREEDADL